MDQFPRTPERKSHAHVSLTVSPGCNKPNAMLKVAVLVPVTVVGPDLSTLLTYTTRTTPTPHVPVRVRYEFVI